jgi:hypothetical protein
VGVGVLLSNAPPVAVPIRLAVDVEAAARDALAAVHRHLGRCKLSANTVEAYQRQTAAYVTGLTLPTYPHRTAGWR